MALIKCTECGREISDEALTCPNCGKPQKNKPLSVSISTQAVIYSVSLFLPPLGFWYVWKYLRQKDQKAKKIGYVALALTILSIIGTIWFSVWTVNLINQSVSSYDFLNNY
jgi:hypothetical protein